MFSLSHQIIHRHICSYRCIVFTVYLHIFLDHVYFYLYSLLDESNFPNRSQNFHNIYNIHFLIHPSLINLFPHHIFYNSSPLIKQQKPETNKENGKLDSLQKTGISLLDWISVFFVASWLAWGRIIGAVPVLCC